METSDWKAQVRERVLSDAALISEGLFDGKPLGAILSLRAADEREDEFRPCFVECEAGHFLYKPRDLRFEDAFGKLAVSLFKGDVQAPRYVLCEGYGYAEFVQFEPMPVVTDKPNLLSYRMGKVHALFHALGRLDTTSGNIVARDNIPVLIDVEVCLDPKQYPLDAVQQRLELAARENETLRELLASPFRGAAGLFAFARVPRSAIESLLPCRSAAPAADSPCALPLGFESYVRGYREGWSICLAHRGALEAFVKDCEGWIIRVVLPLGSPLQQRLAEQLEPSFEGEIALPCECDAAVLEELRASAAKQAEFQRGPIYRTQVGSRTLYDVRAGREYPDFFAASALDNTLAHLAQVRTGQADCITALLRGLLSK